MGVLIIFPLEWLIVAKRSPAAWDVGSPDKSDSYYEQLNCVRGQASHSQVFCVISEGVVRIKLRAEAGSPLLRGLPLGTNAVMTPQKYPAGLLSAWESVSAASLKQEGVASPTPLLFPA